MARYQHCFLLNKLLSLFLHSIFFSGNMMKANTSTHNSFLKPKPNIKNVYNYTHQLEKKIIQMSRKHSVEKEN